MKNRFKFNFTSLDISNKNFNILVVLVILMICLVFYLVPYKELSTAKKTLKNEIQTLEGNYNQLINDIPRKEEYEKGIEGGTKKLIELDKLFPAELPQEFIIKTIVELENTVDINLPNVSLGTVQLLANFNINEPSAEGIEEDKEAEETPIKVEVQGAAELDYTKLKNLIRFFNQGNLSKNYNKRIAINNIQCTSKPDTGVINTSFTLNFYGISGGDRQPDSIFLGDFDIGKSGVFIPFSEYGSNTSTTSSIQETQGMESPDFFIRLSSITADQTTVIVGTGISGSNYAFADGNQFIDTKIELTKVNGGYYYKYQAGTDILTAETEYGNLFNPGKSLDLSILSSKRAGSNDKSGANVTIINNTDMVLNINKINDDTALPRFNLVKFEGRVNLL